MASAEVARRYEIEELLRLQHSPLVKKPEGLPDIAEWMPAAANTTTSRVSRNTRQEETITNDESQKNSTTANNNGRRPSLFGGHLSKSSITEDIVLGPPKLSFASANANLSRKYGDDPPHSAHSVSSPFEDDRDGPRGFDRFRVNRGAAEKGRDKDDRGDIRGFNRRGLRDESDGWTSVNRPPRKSFGAEDGDRFRRDTGDRPSLRSNESTREKPLSRFEQFGRPTPKHRDESSWLLNDEKGPSTRDRDRDRDDREDRGFRNNRDTRELRDNNRDQRESRDSRDFRDFSDLRNRSNRDSQDARESRDSRDHDNYRNRNSDRDRDRNHERDSGYGGRFGRAEKDPEWMDSTPDDGKSSKPGRTIDELQRWKERMKASEAPRRVEKKEPTPPPPVEEEAIEEEPAKPDGFGQDSTFGGSLAGNGVDRLFGGWGTTSVLSPESDLLSPSKPETRPTLGQGRSSRFTSFFQPQEQTPAPVKIQEEPQAVPERVASSNNNADKEGFERILKMLGSTSVGSSNQQSPISQNGALALFGRGAEAPHNEKHDFGSPQSNSSHPSQNQLPPFSLKSQHNSQQPTPAVERRRTPLMISETNESSAPPGLGAILGGHSSPDQGPPQGPPGLDPNANFLMALMKQSQAQQHAQQQAALQAQQQAQHAQQAINHQQSPPGHSQQQTPLPQPHQQQINLPPNGNSNHNQSLPPAQQHIPSQGPHAQQQQQLPPIHQLNLPMQMQQQQQPQNPQHSLRQMPQQPQQPQHGPQHQTPLPPQLAALQQQQMGQQRQPLGLQQLPPQNMHNGLQQSNYGGSSGLPPPPALSASPQSFQRGPNNNQVLPSFEDIQSGNFNRGPGPDLNMLLSREGGIPREILQRENGFIRDNGHPQQRPMEPPRGQQPPGMFRDHVSPPMENLPNWLAQNMQGPGQPGPGQQPPPNLMHGRSIPPPPGFSRNQGPPPPQPMQGNNGIPAPHGGHPPFLGGPQHGPGPNSMPPPPPLGPFQMGPPGPGAGPGGPGGHGGPLPPNFGPPPPFFNGPMPPHPGSFPLPFHHEPGMNIPGVPPPFPFPPDLKAMGHPQGGPPPVPRDAGFMGHGMMR